MNPSSKSWAEQEFGSARLGNTLRTKRLVAMADTALRSPAGLITATFSDSAERQGAYKFAENEAVCVGELTAAACRAAAGRAQGREWMPS